MIAGKHGAEDTEELLNAVNAVYAPDKVHTLFAPENNSSPFKSCVRRTENAYEHHLREMSFNRESSSSNMYSCGQSAISQPEWGCYT